MSHNDCTSDSLDTSVLTHSYFLSAHHLVPSFALLTGGVYIVVDNTLNLLYFILVFAAHWVIILYMHVQNDLAHNIVSLAVLSLVSC